MIPDVFRVQQTPHVNEETTISSSVEFGRGNQTNVYRSRFPSSLPVKPKFILPESLLLKWSEFIVSTYIFNVRF